jgi:hypothetical protein
VPFLLLLAGAIVLAVLLVPVSLVLRYRAGTARRYARRWVATLNVAGFALSVGMFLAAATLIARWVPEALTYAVLGVGSGCILGLLGYALTRWEVTPHGLYYTPNKKLVLAITLVVTARILYGLWRGWEAWGAADERTWLAAAGIAGSMGAGAVVLGYYFAYWAAIRWRMRAVGRGSSP